MSDFRIGTSRTFIILTMQNMFHIYVGLPLVSIKKMNTELVSRSVQASVETQV